MDALVNFIGRLIYAVPFAWFGVGHLLNAGMMAGLVPPFIPGGIFWVYFTGAAMILASLAIITGKQGRSACYALALLLLLFIVTVHLQGLTNPQMRMLSMMNLFKDTSLMGAALVISGTYKKS